MRPRNINPTLTLVGAGPGDPDLITVKGIKALADADVVLYDALVNEELLTYAPGRAKKYLWAKGLECTAHSSWRSTN
jgi:uroporphyrin-III C-methyltransferase